MFTVFLSESNHVQHLDLKNRFFRTSFSTTDFIFLKCVNSINSIREKVCKCHNKDTNINIELTLKKSKLRQVLYICSTKHLLNVLLPGIELFLPTEGRLMFQYGYLSLFINLACVSSSSLVLMFFIKIYKTNNLDKMSN